MERGEFDRIALGIVADRQEWRDLTPDLLGARLDLFWRAFGHLDGARFARAIEHHLTTNPYGPNLADVKAAIEATRTDEEDRYAFSLSWARHKLPAGQVLDSWGAAKVARLCGDLGITGRAADELIAKGAANDERHAALMAGGAVPALGAGEREERTA